MSQVFGAFEHTLPGAPFFVAAALSIAALFIAMRVAPPPRGSEERSAENDRLPTGA